jgi:hypothetical protein
MSQDQAQAAMTAPLAGQGQPEPPEPQPAAQTASFTFTDGMFCLFMVVVFCLVFWLGVFTREEALKTEATKRNGEALAAWLKTASDARFKPGYVYAACAGVSEGEAPAETAATASPAVALAAAVPASSPAGQGNNAASEAVPAPTQAVKVVAKSTWGACLDELLAKTELKNMRNPFLGQTPKFVTECSASDRSVVGAIDLDKIIATPVGSAVATVKSDLVRTDAISDKIKIAVTICDRGGYPIKIEEIDF